MPAAKALSVRRPIIKQYEAGERFTHSSALILLLFFLFPNSLTLETSGLYLNPALFAAQAQCGYADRVQFPIDTAAFTLVQEFGASSPRHQGRFHTGEDWYGGTNSIGQSVYAVADGRVTFASPNGWGRDGGVIILEHTFPTGEVLYSMYGHVSDANIEFPAVFTCVSAGEVIASIGDVRPAPHLHWEMRTENPDQPGAGYSWVNPETLGDRRPSKMLHNWSVWLDASYRWRVDLAAEIAPLSPPVLLPDSSLILLDAAGEAYRVIRLSPDGRILWRVNLDRPAVGVIAALDADGAGRIMYSDGGVQPVALDGTLGERAETGIAFDSVPTLQAGRYLVHTADDVLIAFDPQTLAPYWRTPDIVDVRSLSIDPTARTMTIMTEDAMNSAAITLDWATGVEIGRARLREPGSFALGSFAANSPELTAYTQGGLWAINASGEWTRALNDVLPGGRHSAALYHANVWYLYDGFSLTAYDAAGGVLWATDPPDSLGSATLTYQPRRASRDDDDILLLTTSDGIIAAFQPASGGTCNALRIWGDGRSRGWASWSGEDVTGGAAGLLTVAVADQVLALDQDDFLRACG